MVNGQADINAAPAGTTFCLSGTHNWNLTPKSGDRFIGPAVLDGGHTTQYAFEPGSATNVTLSQLEIRNYAPSYQMAAVMTNQSSSGWTLRDLQVHDNGNSSGGVGVAVGPGLADHGRPVLQQSAEGPHERVRQRRDDRRCGDRPQQLHRRQLQTRRR